MEFPLNHTAQQHTKEVYCRHCQRSFEFKDYSSKKASFFNFHLFTTYTCPRCYKTV